MHILLVDDSELILSRLRRLILLKYPDVVITSAKTFHQAEEALQPPLPDVVILDIQLPDGNGIDIAERIRKISHEMKIVILTNYNEEGYRKAAMVAGADYYINKSGEFRKVLPLLGTILSELQTEL
ncbi:MAG: response regulator [Candidatus Marinimicrobia bacterium]|nr:response regulator [Candidatus Neomarinimicrobiota bacterium]